MTATLDHERDTLARLDAEVSAPPAPRPRGAQVLDEAREFYRRHYHFPSSVQLDAFTLWVGGLSHLRGQDHRYLGSTAARLLIRASTSNAGKTLLGDFIALTGGRGQVVFSPATTQLGMVQMIAEENRTVVLDNYDEVKGAKRDGQLAVLLAGAYDKSSWLRTGRKEDPWSYVCAPVAVTAIGDKLRRREDFRPVVERSIVIDVAKRPAHVKVDRFDERDDDTIARVQAIQASCSAWGQTIAPDVVSYRPADLPGLIDDGRTLAMWELLVAIADFAGGEWPERVRRAIRVLVRGEAIENAEDDDPFARLTPAERSMVDASHVLDRALEDARLAAIDAGVEEEEDLPKSVSLTSARLFEEMAKLPGGERWRIPQGPEEERKRIFKARTMALSTDLSMFGVVRTSVKVPAHDGTGRYVNGWWSSDVLPCRPAELPHHRPADLDAHARAVEEDEVPFE
jgi:hypothetical protein